jgi:hypothetical protein
VAVADERVVVEVQLALHVAAPEVRVDLLQGGLSGLNKKKL